MANITIRRVTQNDSTIILQFIKELAAYEKAPNAVKANIEDIEESIFGDNSTVRALICSTAGKPIGFAVYFFNYSTWLGKNGLYLEDLYITPQSRGKGAGETLLRHLAKIAVTKGCGRFEWSVLDWNIPAIEFYKSLGAQPQNEWIPYRLDGEALTSFAKG